MSSAPKLPTIKPSTTASTPRLTRQYSAILKDLQTLHAESVTQYIWEIDRAEVLVKASAISRESSNLQKFGFVFTLEFVNRILLRKDAIQTARNIASRAEADLYEEDKPLYSLENAA